MKTFNQQDYECPCCHQLPRDMIATFRWFDKRIMEPLRNITKNQNVGVSSAYRCPAHNAVVRGVPHSLHTIGKAVDIDTAAMAAESLRPNETIATIRYAIINLAIENNVTEIEVSNDHIHLGLQVGMGEFILKG